jgi:hypothetical protein
MVDSGLAGAGIDEKLVEERDFLGDWEGAMAMRDRTKSSAVIGFGLASAGVVSRGVVDEPGW